MPRRHGESFEENKYGLNIFIDIEAEKGQILQVAEFFIDLFRSNLAWMSLASQALTGFYILFSIQRSVELVSVLSLLSAFVSSYLSPLSSCEAGRK